MKDYDYKPRCRVELGPDARDAKLFIDDEDVTQKLAICDVKVSADANDGPTMLDIRCAATPAIAHLNPRVVAMALRDEALRIDEDNAVPYLRLKPLDWTTTINDDDARSRRNASWRRQEMWSRLLSSRCAEELERMVGKMTAPSREEYQAAVDHLCMLFRERYADREWLPAAEREKMTGKIEKRVIEIFAETLEVDEGFVTPDKELVADLRADSLDSIEIPMALEEEFDIQFSEIDMLEIKTVGDVIAAVEERLAERQS